MPGTHFAKISTASLRFLRVYCEASARPATKLRSTCGLLAMVGSCAVATMM